MQFSEIRRIVTNTHRIASAAILIMLGFACSTALADEESGHHGLPHRHLAVIAGAGIEQDRNGHSEQGIALGIEFEYQFRERWGIGAELERLFGNGTHRSLVTVFPLSFHPNEHWRLFAGPGFESNETGDKYLTRLGFGYEISFHPLWSASPEVVVDFAEGGATTFVIGIAVGRGF